jgi:isopenicillin-N epimerase
MPQSLASHWTLEAGLKFLNHGSFGACPAEVLAHQQQLRDRLERQPVDFFVRELEGRLDLARQRLAAFVGADPAGLVALPNATTGVNAVLRSIPFTPQDELLVTDHAYNACRNALDYVAEQRGATVVVAPLPFPCNDPQEIVGRLLDKLTPRTRLALVDHVTSATGMVLPLADIQRELSGRGVELLVDGAHAPGMLELDLTALGCAYYVGNCHKWICAPKGAAFLHVREELRREVRPLTISHGANTPRQGRSRLHDEFDWMGTDDPTAFLSVPAAIDFMAGLLPGGWSEIRRRNRALALQARSLLADALEVEPPCPESMIASLVAMPIADGSSRKPDSPLYTDLLQERLRQERRIEVPVVSWPAPPGRLIRISAQLYNSLEQYESLAQALREERQAAGPGAP